MTLPDNKLKTIMLAIMIDGLHSSRLHTPQTHSFAYFACVKVALTGGLALRESLSVLLFAT